MLLLLLLLLFTQVKKMTSEYKRYEDKVLTTSQLLENKRALCDNVLIRGDVYEAVGRTLILLITSRHTLVSIAIYLINNLQVRSQGQVKILQWTHIKRSIFCMHILWMIMISLCYVIATTLLPIRSDGIEYLTSNSNPFA